MNVTKNLLTHFIFAVGYFVLLTFFKQWFSLDYAAFWIGALVGTLLPDIDHLIYIYVLRPHELTSQRAVRMLSKGDVQRTFSLLSSTGEERKKLIFHSALFQIVFVLFAFFVVSSSANLFGRGLVLAFLLHLAVDQFVDLMQSSSLDRWFEGLTIKLDKQRSTFYWVAHLLLIFYFGFVL